MIQNQFTCGSESLQIFRTTYPEKNLEPSQTSTMEFFCENSERLETVKYFDKKASSLMYDWVLNRLLLPRKPLVAYV